GLTAAELVPQVHGDQLKPHLLTAEQLQVGQIIIQRRLELALSTAWIHSGILDGGEQLFYIRLGLIAEHDEVNALETNIIAGHRLQRQQLIPLDDPKLSAGARQPR